MKMNALAAMMLSGLMLATVFAGCLGGDKAPLSEEEAALEKISVSISGSLLKIANGLVDFTADLGAGTFSMSWASGNAIENAVAGVCIDSEWTYTPDCQVEEWRESITRGVLGTAKSIEILFKAPSGICIVQNVTVYPDGGYATIRTSILNLLLKGVTVSAIRPFDANPDYGSAIGFTAPEGTVLTLMNGYSSWEYSGVVRVLGTEANQDLMYDQNYGASVSNGTSYWVQCIYDELSGKSYVAGALTAEKWKTTVSYKSTPDFQSSWAVQCGGTGEKVALNPGAEIQSDLIYVKSSNDKLQDMEEYGVLAGKAMNARHVFGPPMGWCSWYYYFDTITEQCILDNANALKGLTNVDYEYVQIDDGWQKLWGDWTVNEKFPNGMDGIAKKIHDMGFKAGIWLAPFLMNPNAPFAVAHPDAFIKSESGSYLTYNADDGSAHWCLDATHPEAQKFLQEVFTNVHDWGYDYIKIDFLFAGAYEGVHYDNTKTGTEALRIGLQIIREAMGNDSYIDGCGAPILPGVGIFDGNRIGGDVFLGMSGYAFMNWFWLIWECRNIAARYYISSNFYHNDPDVIVVRDPYTADEAKSLATACVLCGGVTMLSDNLPELSAERLALLNNKEVYGLIGSGKSAIPIDLFSHADLSIPMFVVLGNTYRPTFSELPQIWYLPLDDGTCAVAIFNWDTNPNYITLNLADIGRGEGTYKLYDMWAGTSAGEASGTYSTMLMPHACQLLKIVG
ncbi:MAG: alpha-galactosidase [Candidatus Thermoplasmatota archaeon]|nr:alpha-galactosidase [Candidatus Thermoplasmatota archaeon]